MYVKHILNVPVFIRNYILIMVGTPVPTYLPTLSYEEDVDAIKQIRFYLESKVLIATKESCNYSWQVLIIIGTYV